MISLDSESCSKENSTWNRLSPPQRKKPKQQNYSKNNTSSSTPPPTLMKKISDDQQQASELNAEEKKDNSIVLSTSIHVPIEERIKLYEQKYKSCMEISTQLSTWIKMTKEKGPPIPLTEGYTIPTTSRSRLPNFLFSSLSTRPKRKSQINNNYLQDISPIPTPVRSSLSSFLKRATESLSTTYVPMRRQSQPTKITHPSTSTIESNNGNKNRRFSLASSLNRFPLPKSSYSNMTERYHHSFSSAKERPVITEDDNETKDQQQQQRSRRYRFSTPPSPLPPLPSLHHYQSQEQRKQHYNISAPVLITTTTSCTSSTTTYNSTGVEPKNYSANLTQSPSSIFLERLHSRAPHHIDGMEEDNKQFQAIHQPDKKSSFYSRRSSSADDDSMTPPSSPSSTDSSVRTLPLTSLYSLTKEDKKQQKHQELTLLTLSPPTSSNNMRKLSSIAAAELAAADISTKEGDATSHETLPQQQKKKRVSLLTTAPSLSTIRLLSQKSHILKRQSMLA